MTLREKADEAAADAEDADSDNSIQILDSQPSTSNGTELPASRKRPLGKNCKDHTKNLVFTTTLQDHVR